MGQVRARSGATLFLGFGRSRYLPFGARLRSLRVHDDMAAVRRAVRTECPALPGVYGVIDTRGELAYVGMSTALRKRLITYFQTGSAIRKEQAIAAHAHTIVWEVAGHELAAQLRELELIRRHQPRFNVKGRQPIRPLGFLYLSREDAPRFRIARRVPRGVRYSWGPMPVNWRVRDAVEIVNTLFKLSDCNSLVPMHFADQRQLFPLSLRVQCLRGETGSCLAPCAGLCSFREYAAQLTSARALLDGRDFSLLGKLEAELQHAAAAQQYERAVRLRDTLERLQYLCNQLAILRAPPLPERFVYPLQVGDHAAWYLIASCRVVASVRVPATSEAAQRSARLLARILQPTPKSSRDADRPASQIVSSWFRTNPNELQSIMPAGNVLDFCRSMALRRA